jgi:hypothetical protein
MRLVYRDLFSGRVVRREFSNWSELWAAASRRYLLLAVVLTVDEVSLELCQSIL